MQKFIIGKILDIRILIVLGILFITSSCQPKGPSRVCYQNTCFEVKVAKTESNRLKGLQFRQNLGEREGMLFIFSERAQHSFWMKDTYIPLDIIWLDDARHIVHIEHNVSPCYSLQCPVYAPRLKSLYVLEINAGEAAKYGLKLGAKMYFDLRGI